MLALFNLSGTEVVMIVIVAIVVFGRRLPEVAGQAAGVVQRMKRSIADLRRETGIDRELEEARRKLEEARREIVEVQREAERTIAREVRQLDVKAEAERALREPSATPAATTPTAAPSAPAVGPPATGTPATVERHPDQIEPPAL